MVRSRALFTVCYPMASLTSIRWTAEKLVSPEMFAKTFCDDLDLDSSHVTEVSRQIREQVQEATGVATMPLRSEAEEKACAEKDLRVVLNVSRSHNITKAAD